MALSCVSYAAANVLALACTSLKTAVLEEGVSWSSQATPRSSAQRLLRHLGRTSPVVFARLLSVQQDPSFLNIGTTR